METLARTRPAAALVAILATAALATGCGDDSGDSSTPEVPSGAVAVVGDVAITKAELDRRAAALRRGPGKQAERRALETQALSALLLEQAIEQEAEERGVDVSRAEVRRRWRGAAGGQFKSKRALRRFLRGQSLADVMRQLRLQELSARIEQQVREDADGDPDEALKEYRREFEERRAQRTACAESYSAAGCKEAE